MARIDSCAAKSIEFLLGKRAEDIKAASNEICANLISNGFTYDECFRALSKAADQLRNTIPNKEVR